MVWVAVVGPARGSCTKKERTCKACYKPFEMSSFSLLYHFQVHLKVTIDAPAWSQQMEGTQTSLLSHLYTPTTLFPHSDPLGCKKTTAKSLKLPRNRHHLRLVSLTKLYLNNHYQARLKSFSMYFSSKNTEAAHFPKNTMQIGISFSYVHGHESYFFSAVYCVSFYNINYNIKGIPFAVIDIIAIIVWRPLYYLHLIPLLLLF